MKLGDGEFAMLEAPEDGFGDPTIGLRHRIPFLGEGWLAAVEWAIKPSSESSVIPRKSVFPEAWTAARDAGSSRIIIVVRPTNSPSSV
ncbi:MAG: hypothetical protein K8R59_08835 [Thermoanaerobaculales bacterium]|nr:hypothetical protein [Thermoanaerobaculales bacterium]